MKNACIVGYGNIGPIHLNAILKCKHSNLYAICDNDPKNELIKEYNVKKYLNFDDVLNDENIDVIHICTPHYLHKEMTKKALLAGKNVVLEKPVTVNIDELNELLNIKTDKKVCVMLQNRTNPCVRMLKEIIKSEEYGKIIGISAFLTWQRTPKYYTQDDWRGKWKTEGGGLVMNQAIHTLDLVDWLGGGVRGVKASISTKKLNDVVEVEDTADALLEMKNGATGLFYASNAYSNNQPPRIEVNFENVTFRYADERLYKITNENVEVICNDFVFAEGKRYWGNGHKKVIESFYQSIQENSDKEFTSLNDAINVMKLVFAFYDSARDNSNIKYI